MNLNDYIVDLLHFEATSKKIRSNIKGVWIRLQKNFPEWACCEAEEDKYKMFV